MAQEIIDIGATANDGTGDPVRDAFEKCKNNFAELYAGAAVSGITTDGTAVYRIVIRNYKLRIDQALTITGFAGTESADYGVTGDWVCRMEI